MTNSGTAPRNNILFNLGFTTRQITHPMGGSAVSFDYNQGDLLYYDASAKYVKPLDSDAHAATLVGVAMHSAYVAMYASMQQSGGPAMVKNYFGAAVVGFGCVATFYSIAATYTHGDTVYFDTDAQTITNIVGGNTHAVGTVHLPQGGTITGSATTLVPVLVIPQFPIQTL